VVEENLAGRIPDGIMMRASLLATDRDAALEVLRSLSESSSRLPRRRCSGCWWSDIDTGD
jgi:hypothetical protein